MLLFAYRLSLAEHNSLRLSLLMQWEKWQVIQHHLSVLSIAQRLGYKLDEIADLTLHHRYTLGSLQPAFEN